MAVHSVSPTAGLDPVKDYLKSIGRSSLLTAEQEVDLSKRVEAGLYAEYLLERKDLDEAYRVDLELVAEDGHRAKALFIEANLRLVVSVAKKYARPPIELLDVVQEGNLGLIRAVEKFDYTKGWKFSTYAMWWIRQAIQRGLIDISRVVRLPVHIMDALSKLARLKREWVQNHNGNEPTVEDLCSVWNQDTSGDDTTKPKKPIEPARIEFLMELNLRPASFDEEIGDDHSLTIGDLIEDADAVDITDIVSRIMLTDLMRSVLDTLTAREAAILAMRHGIYDGNEYTLEEIGRELGVTRERIRQLEKQALTKLRRPDTSELLLDYAS